MNISLKSVVMLVVIASINLSSSASVNPHIYIDQQAQKMVSVITENEDLYSQDPDLFISKINYIFEPMVDFRRVGASVMGKKYYLAATKEQRIEFIEAFKSSLLNTYSSTLAQWGDQKIETIFPDEANYTKVVDVQQNLITSSNIYPITYKVRNDGSGNWLIINIIVNGVNLGLTFRNQFQALATEHSENIDLIIQNWTSDANL
jgi:phospholipid transport system substrate-binding protein